MRRVLTSTSALILLSTPALAEITITGIAEMGIAGGKASGSGTAFEFDENGNPIALPTPEFSESATTPSQFVQDVDVTFTMTGETDGGLTFGATVDIDEAGGLGNEFDDQGVAIFISGDFGTVTIGDIDGAVDRVITDAGNIGNPGSLDDSETVHLGYLGSWLDESGDGQIVRYDYVFDAFQFAFSLEQGPSGDNGLVLEGDDDLTWAIGLGYAYEFAGGSADFGIGYQSSDNGAVEFEQGSAGALPSPFDQDFFLGGGEADVWAIGAVVTLDNGFDAGFTYSDFDFSEADNRVTHWSIGLGYTFDAFSIHANYGQYDGEDQMLAGYGISAGYDLGGGAAFLFGWGHTDANGTFRGNFDFDGDGDSGLDQIEFDDLTLDTYSLGLSFAF